MDRFVRYATYALFAFGLLGGLAVMGGAGVKPTANDVRVVGSSGP